MIGGRRTGPAERGAGGRSVLVTRPGGDSDPVVARLVRAGVTVHAVPAVITRPLPPGGNLDEAAARLPEFDWVVVTSAAGAEALAEAWARAQPTERAAGHETGRGGEVVDAAPALGLDAPVRARFAAVGPATADALRRTGFTPSIASRDGTATGIVAALRAMGDTAGLRVLLPRASAAAADLPAALRAAGARVEEVVAYETIEAPAESAGPLRGALADPDLAAIAVASGSAVRGLVALASSSPDAARLRSIPFVSIGPSTSAEVRRLGLPLGAQATVPTAGALAHAVLRLLDVPHAGPADGDSPDTHPADTHPAEADPTDVGLTGGGPAVARSAGVPSSVEVTP